MGSNKFCEILHAQLSGMNQAREQKSAYPRKILRFLFQPFDLPIPFRISEVRTSPVFEILMPNARAVIILHFDFDRFHILFG